MANRISGPRPKPLSPLGIGVRDQFEVGAEPVLQLLGKQRDDVEGIRRKALGELPSLDEALLAPDPAHAQEPVDLGAVTGALQKLASRPNQPGESPIESRMRQIAARYLDLRLEIAAGMARISLG